MLPGLSSGGGSISDASPTSSGSQGSRLDFGGFGGLSFGGDDDRVLLYIALAAIAFLILWRK